VPEAQAAPQAETAAPALARGLVAHWRFEEGRGSAVARDGSGHGHDCLLRELDPAVAWVEGAVGGALDLGERGWLDCRVPEARAGGRFEMTVAAWIRRTRERATKSVIATRQLPSASAEHLFFFALDGGNVLVWSNAWTGWVVKPLRSRLDGWIHVAFTHDGHVTKLYADGALVHQKEARRPRGEGLVHSPLTIGATRYLPDPDRVRSHLDGLVDEVALYDRALSEAEVAAVAAGALGP
jgi:hypothetical protein